MTKNELIEDNINLVYFIIGKYYPRYLHDDDIIQTGMLGLCKAVDTFDDTRGSTISTYASKCILNELRIEFRNRAKHYNVLSLDYPIRTEDGNDIPQGDAVVGEEDIDFDSFYLGEFYSTLSEKEKKLIHTLSHHNLPETAKIYGVSHQRIQKLRRDLNRKWREYNDENSNQA